MATDIGFMGRAIPAIWLTLATLLAALPWGLGAGTRMLPPLAVAVLIAIATARRADALPAWLVLGCGIAYDSLTLGPLGFWGLVWLSALGVAQLLNPVASTLPGRIATGVLALAIVGALNWALASLYQLQTLPIPPYSWVTAAAIVAAVLATITAELWGAARPARAGGLNLERGG